MGIRSNLAGYNRDTYSNQDDFKPKKGIDYLDCSLGTNPYGCPPGLLDNPPLLTREMLVSYPQANKLFLEEIVKYWQDVAQLDKKNIVLEAGTLGVIERLNRLYVDAQSTVLGYCPQFSDYMQDVLCCGGNFNYVLLDPQNSYQFSADALLTSLRPDCDLIYLDNPNNPTGQIIPLREIEAVVEAAAKMDVAVLVDEAYGDFMERDNSAVALVNKYPNLYVARSFTKGFGLAGLRTGYAVMSACLEPLFAKVSHPFPVNAPGQIYATKALQESSFLEYCKEKFSAGKREIISSCTRLIVPTTSLTTPIITLIHPCPEIDLYVEFLKRQVITTSGSHFIGLGKNSIRLRLPAEQTQILQIIKDINAM